MSFSFKAREEVASDDVVAETAPVTGSRVFPRWEETKPIMRGGPEQIEVALAWGDVVLRILHPDLRRPFRIGEGEECDLLLPREALGLETLKLLFADEVGAIHVSPPQGARGILRFEDGTELSLGDVRTTSPSGRSFPLATRSLVRIELGELTITVSSAPRPRAIPRAGYFPIERGPAAFFAMSLLTFSGIFGSLAYFVPPLGLEDEEAIEKERLIDLSHYLNALAVKEKEREAEQPTAEDGEKAGAAESQAGPGQRGTLGNTRPVTKSGRLAVTSEVRTETVQLARTEALAAARQFGMIGILNAGSDALTHELMTSPFASGPHDVNALGDLWSADIGEATGTGGLTPYGAGQGGGGLGEGVGLDGRDPLGGGAGCRGCAGRGGGVGRVGGRHRVGTPTVRPAEVTLNGRMPAEVIRRTVRQNFGRFRFCYEQGLARHPGLEGRVSIRFVIGRDGAVSNVGLAGSDLPDGQVTSCLQTAFYGLSFPQPEDGIVRVTYPIIFSPE